MKVIQKEKHCNQSNREWPAVNIGTCEIIFDMIDVDMSETS